MSPFLVELTFGRILAWEILCTVACFGFGWPIQWWLLPKSTLDSDGKVKSPSQNFGSAGAFGVAFFLVAGGVLNLLGWVQPTIIVTVVGVGVALCVWRLASLIVYTIKQINSNTSYQYFSPTRLLKGFVFILLCMMAWAHFAFKARSLEYNPVDDYQAYMVFPAKILADGGLEYEPFSERRLVASLGGKYILDAVVLCGNGFKSLSGADNAIGLVILLGALWGLGSVLGVPFWARATLWFWALLMGPPTTNLTPVTLVIPLIITLSGGLQREQKAWRGKIHLSALLLVSGILLLKNSFIPLVVLLILGWAVPELKFRWTALSGIIKSIGLSFLGMVILCLPWMINSYQDCLTLWFPILGSGTSAVAYTADYQMFNYDAFGIRLISALGEIISQPSYLALLLTILGLILVRWSNSTFNPRHFTLPISALVATVFILAQQPSPQGDRFAFAGTLAGTFYGFAVLTKYGTDGLRDFWVSQKCQYKNIFSHQLFSYLFKKSNWLNLMSIVAALAVCYFSVSGSFASGRLSLCYASIRDPIRCIRNISNLNTLSLSKDSDILRYRNAQSTLPKGAVVLDRTLMPFIWDFNQQKIYITDLPGAASPPPGMPIGKGPEALLTYLRSQGIQFVAYDYAAEGGLYSKLFGSTEFDPKVHPWQRSQYRYARLVQQDMMRLGELCRTIFKDDKMEIFELGRPR